MTHEADDDEPVLMEVAGRVARIRLNRPKKLNSLTPRAYTRLAECVASASARTDVDVITLTGEGRAFSTGGDLGSVRGSLSAEDTVSQVASVRELVDSSYRAFTGLDRSEKTIIAAVNGVCHAGGLAIALCSDLVVAVDTATFRVPEALVGLADPYVPVRLARRVGPGFARIMMYTGRTVDAEAALSRGLVDQVVASDQLDDAVDRLVGELAGTSASSRGLYKRALAEDVAEFDRSIYLLAHLGVDAREGTTAFVEKRPPVWTQGTGDTGARP